MRNILLISSILLFAAGCANTANDFRATTPVLTLISTKNPEKVAMCIMDGWEGVVNGFNMRPKGEGYGITFVNSGLIYYMADIEKVDTGGSSTKFWVGTFTLSSYVENLGNIAKRCQL